MPLLFLAGVLALLPRAQAEPACVMLETQQSKKRVHVELSAHEPEKTYCIRAQKGQRLRVEISNAQGVEPSGRVISPAGEMDGGPGGPFYRGECREAGIYQIQVGQRGPKRAGSYDLTIEITPSR